MNCSSLSIAEVDQTFFGQGKRQQEAAIKICQGCPLTQECTNIAKSLGDNAVGVFGGKSYKNGKVVR